MKELIKQLKFPFLAGNVKDATWGDPVFQPSAVFERGGLRIGVIGQAFPYTPIANPRYLMPDWSFGIDEEKIAANVEKLRADKVDLVVLLSHNGFDVDRKLAGRVKGIDVILTGHTHDALPMPVKVGDTLLVAAGSHGKFLARLDLEVRDRRIQSYEFRLIPVLSEVIDPDPDITALVYEARAPYRDKLDKVLGRTEALLYRRGNFNGTFDDLICQALLAERDAEIALSPGFRWGSSLLPGPGHHRRRRLQPDRHHLSRGLSHRDDRRVSQAGAGGRRRQSVQPRSLLPAGRRHGARGRACLHDRRSTSRSASASPT